MLCTIKQLTWTNSGRWGYKTKSFPYYNANNQYDHINAYYKLSRVPSGKNSKQKVLYVPTFNYSKDGEDHDIILTRSGEKKETFDLTGARQICQDHYEIMLTSSIVTKHDSGPSIFDSFFGNGLNVDDIFNKFFGEVKPDETKEKSE